MPKKITNLKSEEFDSIYATTASIGSLLSTTNTQTNIYGTSLTIGNNAHVYNLYGNSLYANNIVEALTRVSSANLNSANLTSSNIRSSLLTTGSIVITAGSLHVIPQNGVSNIKLYNYTMGVGSGDSWGVYNHSDFSLSFYYQNAGGAFYNNLQLNPNNNAVFIGGITCGTMNVSTGNLTCSAGNLITRGMKTMAEVNSNSTQSNANGITITPTLVLNGLLNRTSVNAGQTDTLDSASNFVSAFPQINTGYVLKFYYINGSSNNITLAGGTSIQGETTLVAGNSYCITLIFTSTADYYVICN